jgi:hypothetical protein
LAGLILILVFLVFAIWLWLKQHNADMGSTDSLRLSVEESLRMTLEAHPELGLSADEMQVMKVEEGKPYKGPLTSYTCSILLRNARGDYYFFVFRHDQNPYIKSASQGLAMAKLGDRYIPPPT